MESESESSSGTRQKVGLFLGPLLFFLMLSLPPLGGMPEDAQKMAAVALLMATWWMCEALPIPITSILPIILFPTLGVMHTKEVTPHYASDIIFLFMGGFIIALAMQRWNLHKRIAMHIVKTVGNSAGGLIFGFMIATAVLSAFVSNTATTVMMLPVGIAIVSNIAQLRNSDASTTNTEAKTALSNFALNLMLGIAYAATIGGMATLIGTPPNAVLAGYMAKVHGFEISFFDWMIIGVPLAIIMIPITWFWLTKVANPIKNLELKDSKALIDAELKQLGPMSKGEKATAIIFMLTAFSWIFKAQIVNLLPSPHLVTDAAIAMAGALALFLIPVDWGKRQFVMTWEAASKLPWGVLILFGGGLALANGFTETNLSGWIGAQVELLGTAPIFLLVVAVTVLIVFLTELTSNTATTAMIVPILAAIAIGLGQNPLLLAIPATLAASCAFMLPVATPPNAIVFGSGHITIPQMCRSGFGLNLIGISVVIILFYSLVMSVFGIQLGELPNWVHRNQ